METKGVTLLFRWALGGPDARIPTNLLLPVISGFSAGADGPTSWESGRALDATKRKGEEGGARWKN